MKYFVKVFLCMILVVTIALALAGYFLISQNFEASVERENGRALEEYQLLKFTLQAGLISAAEQGDVSEDMVKTLASQTAQLAPEGNLTAIFIDIQDGQDLKKIFSDFPLDYDFNTLKQLQAGELGYITQKVNGRTLLVVSGYFEQNGVRLYLSTARNISEILAERQAQTRGYVVIYLIILCISAAVMFVISFFLTQPIKKLTQASARIADGHYSERAQVNSQDEIGALSSSFNAMAQTVEDKIHELEDNARQKEDFVANFAHELKTPLTSVIGYADMLYTKPCDQEMVKMASGYILGEGLRLEALSLKLMDLIVLGKQDFVLEEVASETLLEDISNTLLPLMRERKVVLEWTAQPDFVWVEYDLVKAMIMNLIDNASKADSTEVKLIGKRDERGYLVRVQDNGRGIPGKELARITEAFYMVDKARSRGQHGAGLGLAIASKIAALHQTSLQYESEVGKGTTVWFYLPVHSVMEQTGKGGNADETIS